MTDAPIEGTDNRVLTHFIETVIWSSFDSVSECGRGIERGSILSSWLHIALLYASCLLGELSTLIDQVYLKPLLR
jgi:hypothetical protein